MIGILLVLLVGLGAFAAAQAQTVRTGLTAQAPLGERPESRVKVERTKDHIRFTLRSGKSVVHPRADRLRGLVRAE